MEVYYRQPYSGELVFTAFAGSHQDAINKGMHKLDQAPERFGMGWKVPYLHVDPHDLGREYQSLIRINSQSGKGGVAWVLEQDYGLQPPKGMHPQIGTAVQELSESVGREITGDEVYQVFQDEFVTPAGPYELAGYWPRPDDTDPTQIHGEIRIRISGVEKTVRAEGNGPVNALDAALRKVLIPLYPQLEEVRLVDYKVRVLTGGTDATTRVLVESRDGQGARWFTIGVSANIVDG
ncbi:hypothetical protein LCGC14_2233140, partial [marine sediment metagenome]